MSSFINGVVAAAGAAPAVYVEDVFSTYLYTGTGVGSLSITNNIDLSTKGGLVWVKDRSIGTPSQHTLVDTVRGATKSLQTNSNGAEYTANEITAFSSSGFTVNHTGSATNSPNYAGDQYVSWTFRKQKKFFDVVTYTGTGSSTTISHNLGSVPGMIIVKRTDTTSDWAVYHRSLGTGSNGKYQLKLNATDSQWDSGNFPSDPTSSVFSIGNYSGTNASGGTYVAYLFAYDAGGFGLTGSDSIVSCGSFTGQGSSTLTNVNLGWEPQFLLVKRADNIENWFMWDNMRGFANQGTTAAAKELKPNTSDAEATNWAAFPSSTGFSTALSSGATYIYMAIRRGPMKTPIDATKVYNAISRSATGTTANVTGVGFAPDALIARVRGTSSYSGVWDKLRGPNIEMVTQLTYAESSFTNSNSVTSFNVDGVTLDADSANQNVNYTGTIINWFFRRARGFFDIVTYTGTGSATTVSHNLGVVPELMIVKRRSATSSWWVYNAALGGTKDLRLNVTDAFGFNFVWNDTDPSASSFSINTNYVNASGSTYVAYLFASCPGVSKVGSFTLSGSSVNVDCGFTNGARFVLLKLYDGTGNWWILDSTRGINAGNDPVVWANLADAETSSYDILDPYSPGFTADAATLASGNYIYLAIA